MVHFILIFIGGGFGAGMRYLCTSLALRLMGTSFPWGTLFVNIIGSFFMGIFFAWLSQQGEINPKWSIDHELRSLVATGFLGGFTTFSAFSLDAAHLWNQGELIPAFSYVAGSVLIAIAALLAGIWIFRNMHYF